MRKIWIPVIHEISGPEFGGSAFLAAQLKQHKPKAVFIEADRREVEAGDSEIRTALEYCQKEKIPLVPIDRAQRSTRRILMNRLMLHPIEAYRLLQLRTPEISGLDEATLFRRNFEAQFPNAFDVLYSQREAVMMGNIQAWLRENGKNGEIAVIAGAAHLAGLQRLEEAGEVVSPEILRDLHKSSVSVFPFIFIFYFFLPICLIFPVTASRTLVGSGKVAPDSVIPAPLEISDGARYVSIDET